MSIPARAAANVGRARAAMIIEVRQLAAAPLAGARIQRARWNPGGRVLELQFGCADGARGAVELLLRYRGVEALEPALPQLAMLVEDVTLRVAASRAAGRAAALEHVLELEPAGQIVVQFQALELAETLRTGADYGETAPRFLVLSC